MSRHDGEAYRIRRRNNPPRRFASPDWVRNKEPSEGEAKMAQEDGWDLEGIPRPWWPYVRDVLVAREIYKLSTLVSDKKIGQGLEKTAEGILLSGARHLAQTGAKVA
jgi:hypothetical protein